MFTTIPTKCSKSDIYLKITGFLKKNKERKVFIALSETESPQGISTQLNKQQNSEYKTNTFLLNSAKLKAKLV
jgi:hypothetical protein